MIFQMWSNPINYGKIVYINLKGTDNTLFILPLVPHIWVNELGQYWFR